MREPATAESPVDCRPLRGRVFRFCCGFTTAIWCQEGLGLGLGLRVLGHSELLAVMNKVGQAGEERASGEDKVVQLPCLLLFVHLVVTDATEMAAWK